MRDSHPVIAINRAAVLTLWAAVVAERLGFDHDEALTLGRAVAGLNAHTKGVRLGIYQPAPEAERERRHEKIEDCVELLHREVPVIRTAEGVRALSDGRPISPASVEHYLSGKFGSALGVVRDAMTRLAGSMDKRELAVQAYRLYTRFRPEIPEGVAGWGARGELHLNRITGSAQPA